MSWLGIENADYRTYGAALALTLLLFFTSLTLYLGWQYRSRKREPMVAIYDALCRKLARAGVLRQPHEGPKDYLQRAAVAQPSLAADLHELRQLYTSLRYGPSPMRSELSRFKYLVNSLRPQMQVPASKAAESNP
jgi:protein-glutamine gamma-glutamyltransferase